MAAGTFYSAPGEMDVTFDENIASVTMVMSVNGNVEDAVTITESGTFIINGDCSTDYIKLTVALADGYQLAEMDFSSDYNELGYGWIVTVEGNVITYIPQDGNAGANPNALTILTEATEKEPTFPTATFDLSTLNLSVGTHNITVKARAEGYADSVESATVEYVVQSVCNTYNITTNLFGCYGYSTNPTEIDEDVDYLVLQFTPNDGYAFPTEIYVTGAEYEWVVSGGAVILSNPTGAVYISISCVSSGLKTFTVDGIIYESPYHYTWEMWVNSDYNTSGFSISGAWVWVGSGKNIVCHPLPEGTSFFQGAAVEPDEYIVPDTAYELGIA